MKKCPVCEKEFDDNMRFCQVDGTPLVAKPEEAAPADPYKTMVARKEDIAAAIPPEKPAPELIPDRQPTPETAIPAALEDQLLEIPPKNDPNKTQFVSEAELRAEMAAHSADNQIIEVPPATESAPSEIPITGDPVGTPPAEVPPGVPPSPFSAAPAEEDTGPANFPTSPPIPSPFSAGSGEAKSSLNLSEEKPPAPKFAEPSEAGAFQPQEIATPIVKAEFNPSTTPEPHMQNPQNFGQSAAPSGKQNQTLAIVSLILGILGMTLCCGTLVPSLAALITGFMARGKASNDPANFGGGGLALGGIITGAVGLLVGLIYLIFVFFFGGLQLIMQGMG